MTHYYRAPRIFALTDAAATELENLQPSDSYQREKLECVLLLWSDGNYDIMAKPNDELVQLDGCTQSYSAYQVPPCELNQPRFTTGEVPGVAVEANDPMVIRLTSKNCVKATLPISFNALTECSWVCAGGRWTWKCP